MPGSAAPHSRNGQIESSIGDPASDRGRWRRKRPQMRWERAGAAGVRVASKNPKPQVEAQDAGFCRRSQR